jgi:hypothetical protein
VTGAGLGAAVLGRRGCQRCRWLQRGLAPSFHTRMTCAGRSGCTPLAARASPVCPSLGRTEVGIPYEAGMARLGAAGTPWGIAGSMPICTH